MGAPKGNQFWKLRSKHGRDKLFASPQLMWEAACEYFQWCIDNPVMISEAKVVSMGSNLGSEVMMVKTPHLRVFTLQGLCLYMDTNTAYFNQFKAPAKDLSKSDEENKKLAEDYEQVILKIREVIHNQKFTGAASGEFNANVIIRDLGLTDKTESKIEGELRVDQITGMDVK